MLKPAVSPKVLRLVTQVLGLSIAAVGVALNGVDFDQLVAGGPDAIKKLGLAIVVGVGAALFGWATQWFQDYSIDELSTDIDAILAAKPPVVVEPSVEPTEV